MVIKYKFIALATLLIALISIISCLTFDPNHREMKQAQAGTDQEQAPGHQVAAEYADLQDLVHFDQLQL